ACVRLATPKAIIGKRIPTKTSSPSRISRAAAATINSPRENGPAAVAELLFVVMIYAGKFTRAGSIISNALLDSHTVCPLFLQFREQPAELAKVTQLVFWPEGVF